MAAAETLRHIMGDYFQFFTFIVRQHVDLAIEKLIACVGILPAVWRAGSLPAGWEDLSGDTPAPPSRK